MKLTAAARINIAKPRATGKAKKTNSYIAILKSKSSTSSIAILKKRTQQSSSFSKTIKKHNKKAALTPAVMVIIMKPSNGGHMEP